MNLLFQFIWGGEKINKELLEIDMINYNRIKKIASMALVESGICSAPISVAAVASAHRLTPTAYSSLPQSMRRLCGEITEDSILVGRSILYNDKKPAGRIRFSLAHEIGHYLLGHGSSDPTEEKEANFFAKYLLAPPVVVHYMNIENADRLAENFALSGEFARNAFAYYLRWSKSFGAGGDIPQWDQAVLERFFGGVFSAPRFSCRLCGEKAGALTHAGECVDCAVESAQTERLFG